MNVIRAGKKYMAIFTSRGCPYRCIYCHNIFGKKFRKRTAENVFAEIKELHDRYGVDEIHIFDDIFNLDIQRAKKICDLIINSNIRIKLAFPNALRGDTMDKGLILKLKHAGAYAMTFAMETASLRLQNMIHKNIDIEKLKEAIDFASSLGILTKCYFMLGFPSETIDEMKKTIDFACNSSLLLASFFIVTVQKGTGLFSLVKELYPAFNVDFNYYDYYVANRSYERFIGFPLEKIQRQAYLKFFLNIRRLVRLFMLTPCKIYLFESLFFHTQKYCFAETLLKNISEK